MSSNAQSGLLQMLGPTQNMSIYRKRNGEYGLRRKGGPTAKRFAKDPNYAQARINTGEFGQAAKGSALIRRAFRSMMPKVANDELHSRLTKVCKEVINTDSGHPRGSRMLMNGDVSLLKDFNFNPACRFGTIVRKPFQHTVNRVAGTVTVCMHTFTPADFIRFPKHATHARLIMGVAAPDFEKETFTFESSSSAPVPKGRKPIKLEDLTVQIPAGTSGPLFIAMAIEFMTLEKGAFTPIRNCQFNGLQLTGIDTATTAAAQQSLPCQETPIVAETVTDTTILKGTVPMADLRGVKDTRQRSGKSLFTTEMRDRDRRDHGSGFVIRQSKVKIIERQQHAVAHTDPGTERLPGKNAHPYSRHTVLKTQSMPPITADHTDQLITDWKVAPCT